MGAPRNPSPRDFWTAFLQAINKEESACSQGWLDCQCHTQTMFRRVFPEIARALGLTYCQEYWQLDAVFYHERDHTHFPEPTWVGCTYAKYISVALEHENDPTYVVDEMNKLQIYNVPLAVLITYVPRSRVAEKLRTYAEIIHDGDVLANASTERRQLVIFGYSPIEWEAYVYDRDKFQLVTAYQSATN